MWRATRAQEQLHLFCSEDASILYELRQSGCFEVMDCEAGAPHTLLGDLSSF